MSTTRKKTTKKKSKKTNNKNKNIVSKADKARAIMKKHYGKKERKEIIEMFMKDAGLTKAGSNTYYFNLSKEMK